MIMTKGHEYTNNIIKPDSVVKLIHNQKQNLLDDFYHKLENQLGCTYMFYIYEDLIHDKKIIYTSNWEWQNCLIGEKLINRCPIFRAGSEALLCGKKSIILPWNYIHCKTSLEKEIQLFRNEFNIANGLGISHINGSIREGIGLGGDIYDSNFYLRLLENNLISKIMKKTRTLALQNTTYFIIH